MSQAVNGDDRVSTMASIHGPIHDDLRAVEEILDRELRSPHEFVEKVARHSGRLRGKRLRPALLLLSARAIGKVSQEHHLLAAVVEMIHLATLAHDDVLDDAAVRRHQQTVNAKWSNQTSVLLGDYLFTHAFYLSSTLGTAIACQIIGQATNIVCEGELRQTGNQGRFDVSEDEYLSIIDAKTAELCACSCNLGATFANSSEDVAESMTRFGRNLGVAFQIADDVLDISGVEAAAGKSLGTDLETQKLTLPLIHVWQEASASERLKLATILRGPAARRRRELHHWIDRFSALEYAHAKAKDYADAATAELDTLPPSAARDVLQQLTAFVVNRSC